MADFVFTQACGKMGEWCERVNGNDPTNAVLYVHAWVSTETDATLRDLNDVAAVQSNVNTAEATNTNYSEKTIADGGDITVTINDANNSVDCDMVDQTWTSVSSGDNWTDLSVDYDSDSTSGVHNDSAVKPGTWHDFAVTPDGSDITVQWNANGFFRATAS